MCGAITLLVLYMIDLVVNVSIAVDIMPYLDTFAISQIVAFIWLVPAFFYLLKFTCGTDELETRICGVTAVKWIMFHTVWLTFHYVAMAAEYGIDNGFQLILTTVINFVIVWWWLQSFKKYV